MAGLSLGVNGVIAGSSPQYGSMSAPSSVSEAAFGIGGTAPTPNTKSILTPNDGFGVAFWVGAAAIGLMVLIRKSLPN